MDQDIVAFARREYNLFLGERTAEDIKIAIGSAYPGDWDSQRVSLRGRDLLTGLPRSVEVGADQIREAIEPSVVQIVDTIKDTIEETPPELVADIMDQGIVLAGGGALLSGLDRRVADATQMPVHVADDPLTCVARGTGRRPPGARQDGPGPRLRHVRPAAALGRRRRPLEAAPDDDARCSPTRAARRRAVAFTILLVGQPDPDGDLVEPRRHRVPERDGLCPAPDPGRDPRRRRHGRRRGLRGRRDRGPPLATTPRSAARTSG